MDKIQEPVKEARVSPIKKEKVVEDVSFKQVKADKKSKRNGHVKRQEFSNGHEDHHHTAVKIHLDKLKVSTISIFCVYLMNVKIIYKLYNANLLFQYNLGYLCNDWPNKWQSNMP